MKPIPSDRANADTALAHRDTLLPCLAYLLDNDRLSGLLGEPVRITRVRYKPRTSALVAFRRTRNGRHDYGWAMTRTPDGNAKLHRREHFSSTHGGDIRILCPDQGRPDALVAVGGFEDDWELAGNLLWLRDHGLQRLGAPQRPGSGLCGGAGTILRYKPERRLVLRNPGPGGSLVIKAAAQPFDAQRQRHFWQRLDQYGVPVLPLLADEECSDHGISASPTWGEGDLGALHGDTGALRAGEALARLHRIPQDPDVTTPGRPANVLDQLEANRAMITTLVPALEEAASLLAARLRHRLQEHTGHRACVLIHGDFSPDQVLVSGSEVRIIDFDRTHTDAPEADLGAFAAVDEITTRAQHRDSAGGPKTAQLTEGYVRAGGEFTPGRVNLWAAFRLFTGSIDPFRDRAPRWASDMAWHLDRARELTT